jgi:hypothetical protein
MAAAGSFDGLARNNSTANRSYKQKTAHCKSLRRAVFDCIGTPGFELESKTVGFLASLFPASNPSVSVAAPSNRRAAQVRGSKTVTGGCWTATSPSERIAVGAWDLRRWRTSRAPGVEGFGKRIVDQPEREGQRLHFVRVFQLGIAAAPLGSIFGGSPQTSEFLANGARRTSGELSPALKLWRRANGCLSRAPSGCLCLFRDRIARNAGVQGC